MNDPLRGLFFKVNPLKLKKKWSYQNKNEKKFIIIVNHTKWVLQKIPSECLWCERVPVWGYVGIESAQSSIFVGTPWPIHYHIW